MSIINTSAPEDVAAFYDDVGDVLETLWSGTSHNGYWEGPDDDSDYATASARYTKFLVDRLNPGPDDTVLDIGCGGGAPTVQLARSRGSRVVGVSISAKDVERGRARAASAGLSDQVTFEMADALTLPFEDESFDHVISIECLSHIGDRVGALAEIRRVLRPGGRVVLTDFSMYPEYIAGLDAAMKAWTIRALKHFNELWRNSPPVVVSDYPDYVREAGLLLDEIIDISDNTRRTGEHVFRSLYEYDGIRPLPAPLASMLHGLGISAEQMLADGVESSHAGASDSGVIAVRAHRLRD